MEKNFDNEREWRNYILNKLDKIEDSQRELLVVTTTNKNKIGFFIASIGILGGVLGAFISKKLGIGI